MHCKGRKCQLASLSSENNFEVIDAHSVLTLSFFFCVLPQF